MHPPNYLNDYNKFNFGKFKKGNNWFYSNGSTTITIMNSFIRVYSDAMEFDGKYIFNDNPRKKEGYFSVYPAMHEDTGNKCVVKINLNHNKIKIEFENGNKISFKTLKGGRKQLRFSFDDIE